MVIDAIFITDKEEALLAWKMLDMNQRWKFWDKWESYLTVSTSGSKAHPLLID